MIRQSDEMPGGNAMQIGWTENQAECIETCLAEVTEVIGHAASVCAHVRDLIRNAAPGPVPVAASSILHMTFLALDALSHRECETLSEAETSIREWRNRAFRGRALQAAADLAEFQSQWQAQGCRSPDEGRATE